jgi:hypothetical protein
VPFCCTLCRRDRDPHRYGSSIRDALYDGSHVESSERKLLACGCEVETSRDFLGRVVGAILTRGADCSRDDHAPGRVVIMPGRENARPQDR